MARKGPWRNIGGTAGLTRVGGSIVHDHVHDIYTRRVLALGIDSLLCSGTEPFNIHTAESLPDKYRAILAHENVNHI
jgi:hypothetical protein